MDTVRLWQSCNYSSYFLSDKTGRACRVSSGWLPDLFRMGKIHDVQCVIRTVRADERRLAMPVWLLLHTSSVERVIPLIWPWSNGSPSLQSKRRPARREQSGSWSVGTLILGSFGHWNSTCCFFIDVWLASFGSRDISYRPWYLLVYPVPQSGFCLRRRADRSISCGKSFQIRDHIAFHKVTSS